jgi:ubiquinone/menaquinone biosynthesis C-methylase UbiE
VAENLVGTLGLQHGARLLDWGCGPAHASTCLAEHGLEVFLYDRSNSFAAAASERFLDESAIHVLDSNSLAELEEHSLDAIVVCSVLQYLDDDELHDLLTLCARLLSPNGVLALVDILPLELDLMDDVRDIIEADLSGIPLADATAHLAALGLSMLRRLRHRLRLRRFSGEELLSLLSDVGLEGSLSRHNFKPARGRQTWLARPKR